MIGDFLEIQKIRMQVTILCNNITSVLELQLHMK